MKQHSLVCKCLALTRLQHMLNQGKLGVADFVSGGGPALVAALITTRNISSSPNAGDQDADAARTLNATAIALLKTLFLDSTILKQVLLTGGSGAEIGTEKELRT